jgi:hypothetical protein
MAVKAAMKPEIEVLIVGAMYDSCAICGGFG